MLVLFLKSIWQKYENADENCFGTVIFLKAASDKRRPGQIAAKITAGSGIF